MDKSKPKRDRTKSQDFDDDLYIVSSADALPTPEPIPPPDPKDISDPLQAWRDRMEMAQAAAEHLHMLQRNDALEKEAAKKKAAETKKAGGRGDPAGQTEPASQDTATAEQPRADEIERADSVQADATLAVQANRTEQGSNKRKDHMAAFKDWVHSHWLPVVIIVPAVVLAFLISFLSDAFGVWTFLFGGRR